MADNFNNGDFWATFQHQMATEDISPSPNLIIQDVMDSFGIPHDINTGMFSGDAGKLKNVDLKRTSPIAAVKASLLEQYATSPGGGLIEFDVDESGSVYLYEVGVQQANMTVYYSVPSNTYVSPKVGVMVTGAKPKLERKVYPWKPIIGKDSSGNEATQYTIWDATKLQTSCLVEGFTSTSVITYKDPILESGQTSFENGIKNLFELDSFFESIIGWAWKIEPPQDLMNTAVSIIQQSQSTVPMLLGFNGKGLLPKDPPPGFSIGKKPVSPSVGGTLRRRISINSRSGLNDLCQTFEGVDASTTKSTDIPLHITIPIREGLTYEKVRGTYVNKFCGVNSIFAVAIPLEKCLGKPLPGKILEENTAANTVVFISSSSPVLSIYRLIPNEDYLITYEKSSPGADDGLLSVLFANNSTYGDNGQFGTNVNFYVDTQAKELFKLFDDGSDTSMGLKGRGTVLPTHGDGSGILIQELWMQIDLDTPSFLINDPRGKASDIAEGLKVSLTPIVISDMPAPTAINGVLVARDEKDKPDNDPTTLQDFEDTPMELALRDMDSGRTLSLNLSSLTEEQTRNLSLNLYNLMKKDMGLLYTHTCSPTSTPKLGARGPKGGIINSINYNYSDQGSYLISVVEGPELFGDFAGLSGGIYYKKVEDITSVGTIIQDRGDHINFKVRVDGVGDIMAINGYPGVLNVKDRVNVTIHNNEVED